MQERYHIEIALPIFDNLIRFHPNGSKEVLEVIITNVFDAEVVHAQVEPDGLRNMFPDARCVGLVEVSMACQTEFEEFVGKDAGLWEAVHILPDFHIDITINGLFT
jgi:hypothetical protein